jgi:hypothetical protein
MSRLGAFLRMQGCNGAQPDGKKIVDELLEHFRELAETDETGAAKVLFSHIGKRWRETGIIQWRPLDCWFPRPRGGWEP